MRKKLSAGVLVLVAMMLMAPAILAATLPDFSQSELDTNWEADRYFPTDGVTSVTAFGRTDVARIGIDSSQTQPGTFQRTEGIKTVGAQDFGTEVEVDLYIDPDWEGKAVRAGLWVVGDDGSGARDNWFASLEFVNNELCDSSNCSNPTNITDHEGFRVWDSTIGWSQNLDTVFSYGDWVTLGISLDPVTSMYTYYINGDPVATATGGSNFIRELFLNSYNYGQDDFPNLSEASYAAHWHAGVEDSGPANPETKNDCMKGGWQDFGFKNQGQCIQFVNTGKDSR